MALLLSALLLASLCTLASRCHDASTWQSPDVEVEEGRPLAIKCCWEGNKSPRVKVEWLKNSEAAFRQLLNTNGTCEFLVWPHVNQNDSGTYRCKVSVDIPDLREMGGNATVVKVVPRGSAADGPGDASGIPLWIPLLIFSLSALLLLVLALVWTCKRRAKNGVRVIYESPHPDSDLSEPDKRSTGSSAGSSAGSSEWRQVMVYESVDYFERAETKPGG
ncbi:uncharacterized protein LOC144213688 [Stigmatopora nigra]